MNRRALITGITGQDGSYLAELLLNKDYEVHGITRRTSGSSTSRINHVLDRLNIHDADVSDAASITEVVTQVLPHELYHLAAQSHVGVSFAEPSHTMTINVLGTLHVLEAVRRFCPECRVYQASSSEMFGNSPPPQNEETPLCPVSPYGISKEAAHRLAQQYRVAYGIHVSCGILFNHESPRRGETFVTRKITRAVARIRLGMQKSIQLGDVSARRDWGYAPDYVRAMWRMLQQDKPDDYVVATGEVASVGDFAQRVLQWHGLDGIPTEICPRYKRPTEIHYLQGYSYKARRQLAWQPTRTWKEIADEMAEADFRIESDLR